MASTLRARRKTTTQAGYGWAHQQQRAKWVPIVAAGQATCHARICLLPSRWIRPGTPWDMGHNDARTAWTGPEHSRCNRADGARKARAKGWRGKARKARRARTATIAWRTSKQW
jgi:hypothetical protein